MWTKRWRTYIVKRTSWYTKIAEKSTKKIRLRVLYLTNEYLKKEADRINQLAINRELEKLFQDIFLQIGFRNTIKSHFNLNNLSETIHMMNRTTTCKNGSTIYRTFQITPIKDTPPTIEEIKDQLLALKSNKTINDM